MRSGRAAATTVFEVAALVTHAGGRRLDGAFAIPARDVDRFIVERMRADAGALIAPAPPVDA